MEPCQLAHYRQARGLKALVLDLKQYSDERRAAFMDMLKETQRWLTVEDIAEQMRVHPETVRRWVRAGQLKSVRAGRQIRVTPEDLTTFLQTTGGNP